MLRRHRHFAASTAAAAAATGLALAAASVTTAAPPILPAALPGPHHPAVLASVATVATAQDATPPPARRRLGAGSGDVDAAEAAAAARRGTARPATERASDDPPTPEPRLPLLREGSRLVDVPGRIDRDPSSGRLRLTIDAADRQSPGHRLQLLPNSRLTELELVLEALGPETPTMRVTGRVFVHGGRNYLLMTHRAIVAPDPVAAPDASPATDAAAGESDGATDGAQARDDDSAESIARDLEAQTGPIGRRPDRPGDGTGGTDEAPEQIEPALLQPEGTRLVDRRGRLQRTAGGAFRIVFDADAEGRADPPMIVLPCRLLDDLARTAGRSTIGPPILIGGEVTIYQGRNYLLPSVYRLPRDLTLLQP